MLCRNGWRRGIGALRQFDWQIVCQRCRQFTILRDGPALASDETGKDASEYNSTHCCERGPVALLTIGAINLDPPTAQLDVFEFDVHLAGFAEGSATCESGDATYRLGAARDDDIAPKHNGRGNG